MNVSIDNTNAKDFRKALLHWFRRNRRDLPWRREPTPYSVWISEVMLQQTVVAAVSPRFERWMRRFPDVASLAHASEQEVLREWEGLGYYSRARNLLAAAKTIVGEHGGRVPDDYPMLRSLPGIGDYTASAILSISFSRPYPVLDANVRRLAMRLLALGEWTLPSEKHARSFLDEAISLRVPGRFNEALMELGETVCLPRAPRCGNCPVALHCAANARGIADQIPLRLERRTIARSTAIFLFMHGNAIYIARENDSPRSRNRFLKGLYSFPKIPECSEADAPGEIARLSGDGMIECRRLPRRIHSYTKYRDRLDSYVIRLASRKAIKFSGGQWVRREDIDRYPFPSVYRKIIADAFLRS